jgi:proteasome assembly chaperone (PAC2) family protein
MDGLLFLEETDYKLPTMIVAFAGWPDAAEAATGAVKYVAAQRGARKLAEIDHEEFYDFTLVRPNVRIDDEGGRVVTWPSNDFFYATPTDESDGILLFVGTEPNLRWRAFASIMLEVARRVGVEAVFTLGALNDAVPHTREPRVTGVASDPEVRVRMRELGIRGSGYEGPTGIHTAFLEACDTAGLPVASLWGHNPHYVTSSSNPRVSLVLLSKLQAMAELRVDLGDLRGAGDAFDSELAQAIGLRSEITSYVTQLEQRYDATVDPSADIPSPSAMVEEMEEFLRQQRGDS